MEFHVSWSFRARNSLKSIFNHIAQDNLPAAEKLRVRILGQTDVLRGSPRIGQRFASAPEREIRQLVEGNYRIFYEIDELRSRVLILTVRHAARRDPTF